MSYNSSLNLNNSDLQEIIQSLESLPNVRKYQEKNVVPSVEEQVVTFDDGYDGLSMVTIDGDEDLKSENIKKGVDIFGIYGTYINPNNGTLSAYSNEEDAIIMGSLSGVYINDRVTRIKNNQFLSCDTLILASFPLVTSIGDHAFESCTGLTSVSFPEAVNIGWQAFRKCTSLTSVNFPKATFIDYEAFGNCVNLTSISFPEATHIDRYVFRNCTLISVNLPNVLSIDYGAFYQCKSLTSINFPNILYIGSNALGYCHSLSALTLGASTVCTLAASDVFNNTPFAGDNSYFNGIPHIYVPASLVNDYQSATNWTYFSSYFVGV